MPSRADTYLDKEQVAQMLAVSTKTLERWMKRRLIPYYRIRRFVRFDLKAVREHLDRNNRIAAR